MTRGLNQKLVKKLLESGRAHVTSYGASGGRPVVKVGKRNLEQKAKPMRDPLASEDAPDGRFERAMPRGLRDLARVTESAEQPAACPRCGADTRDVIIFIDVTPSLRRRVCLACAPAEYMEQMRR